MTTRRSALVLKPLCIVLYLSAAVAANLIIAASGKPPAESAVLVVGAVLVPIVLVVRDVLHDWFGPNRWRRAAKMFALIAAGAIVSYLANGNAVTVAKASALAFAASEAIDFTVYDLLHLRPWLERSNTSNLLSATTDTLVFMWVLFGAIPFTLAFSQIMCKIAGGLVYTLIVQQRRRALLPRHA